ncbi:MAG TPA: hypothetical protein VFK40_02955 [Nitrososphaeraceae archaeon]|nr:hypothetical protein [Nitrososphaeraceae archaeon]
MIKYNRINNILRRVEALKNRIKLLSSLQTIINLPPSYDITARQWSAINRQLYRIESRLLSSLEEKETQYIHKLHIPKNMRVMNAHLAVVEFEAIKAFNFFDTMFDIISQRCIIGKLLAGCEVIAKDAIRIEHPALKILEPPIVFCDRGYGASILREGIQLPYNIKNPVPLIQIPYSRLKTKYDLISIIHEAGHEITNRLKLDRNMAPVIKKNLKSAGAEPIIAELFSLGLSEIIPDLCALLKTGYAHPSSIRDILSVTPEHVFTISMTDPHPTPFIRVLLSFENCRQIWGNGIWNEMEREWIDNYPLNNISYSIERILLNARKYLPLVTKILLETKLDFINGRTIPDLFNLSNISPNIIEGALKSVQSGTLDLKGLKPCAQLAVFRIIRDEGKLSEDILNKLMINWLIRLGGMREKTTVQIVTK